MDFMVKGNKLDQATADDVLERTKTANSAKDLVRVSFAIVAVYQKP